MPTRLVLAPMYRVTDLAFRLLCREQGASLCYTEMINSEALIRNNLVAKRLAQTCKEDRPLAMQVFGARVESMRKAAELLIASREFDFLDLNLGCPSGNVINQGAGSALLKRPKRIAEIVSAWCDLGKPVTAKIRSSPNVLCTIKLAKTIEKAGASAIAIHARPTKQKNKGFVDFVAIKRVKKASGIPVIGNGGVKDKASFERMLEKTGCNAVMIGSAAIGNPGVFSELLGREPFSQSEKALGKTRPYSTTPILREQAFFEYLALCKKFDICRFEGIKQQAVRFFALKRQIVPLLEKAQSIEQLVSVARQEPH